MGRGAYLLTPPTEDEPHRRERELALGRIVGVHRRLTAAHWFSHESAALLWGLPSWGRLTSTHVVQRNRRGAGADPGVTWHFMTLAERDVGEASGLPVTSLERTAVDCAAGSAALAGLVIADGALRAGADGRLLGEVLGDLAGRRGICRARAVLALADGGSESPGETATRFLLLRAGFPVPQTQVCVRTSLATYWTDLGWPEWRVAVEYDGRSKYLSDPEVLVREKRRHDAIVDEGWRLVRVTKEDLATGALVARVLRHAPTGVVLHPRRDLA
ncbi:hypothetical protein [Cellulomonas fimi]|uniref:hypothetical protein n=1 Tax=Cellulomonas fimi TaxID=1708 RepID=UPI0002F08E06|nr:hypothetical protein [Cellulomonas fimi]NNH06615.1 hypothetical protein [Cellulomonas fimi]